jgi:2-methylisocitrate lyase-like PEP mutase family enzyme
MSQEQINQRLKDRVEKRDALLLPGVPNALAARIVEDVGFEAVYVTGAGVANSFLGVPDIGLLSLTQLADHVAAIRDAVGLPIVSDADTGFGNAVNMRHTIRVLERSGASAVQIEDQSFPKRCGHFSGKSVVSKGEMVGKIRAAVDARHDGNFQIIARTDAVAVHGLEDAIDRLHAYREAGADILFLEAPTSVADIKAMPRLIDAPQVLNLVFGGMTPLFSLDELRRMGFAIVLYANAAMQAAIHGMQDVLGHLHARGTLEGAGERMTDFAERQRLVSKPFFDELDKQYAAPEDKG